MVSAQSRNGFTLVELLIVIVVIAILAAVTIVAYNGVQQRANNTSAKTQAAAVAKLLSLYKTGENAYPMTSGAFCATQDDDCRTYNGSVIDDSQHRADFLSAIKTYGTLPASVPHPDDTYYGLSVSANTNFTLDGEHTPILMTFFLTGTKQDCTGIGGMISVGDDPKSDGTINMTRRSYSNQNVNGSGVTRCYEMYPPV